jgi:hypothetical protein
MCGISRLTIFAFLFCFCLVRAAKEKKSQRKTATLSKRTGSVYASGSSGDVPSIASPVVPVSSNSGAFARSGEHSVRATWAPQSAVRLEEALNAMSRGTPIPHWTTRSHTHTHTPHTHTHTPRTHSILAQLGPTGAPDSARGQPSQPASQGGARSGGVRARAKWAFSAEREGELSMGVGDVLAIIDQTNQNWWMAELGGNRGVVPANYVEVLPEEPALPGTRSPILYLSLS